jgi:flagellar biosynthesis chaperone FliJ
VKHPPYPLQAALEQREAVKEDARRRLAESVRALEREEGVLRERETQRDTLLAEADARRARLYDADEGGILSMPEVNRRTEGLRYVEREAEEAARAVEEQKEVLARAEATVESRRAALVEADRELRAVEKNREGWLEGWKREAARREQRQAEEVVTARYAAERSGADEGERS